MKKHALKAEARTVTGRKVKKLRGGGMIPATVYGKKVKSRSLTVKTDDFTKIYTETGETGLIELSVGDATLPVLIHTVQKGPVYGDILHVEFYQVDLKEKVKANVRLETIGESQAVKDKIGVLLEIMSDVEVEALPGNLPEKIEIDISTLANINDEFKVSDLNVPQGVTVVTDPNQIVIRVAPLVSKETEEEVKAEEAAAQEAAAAEVEAVPSEKSETAEPSVGGSEEKTGETTK
jgi:large subunit ribosomal protein L25